jgi:hypothetical protein
MPFQWVEIIRAAQPDGEKGFDPGLPYFYPDAVAGPDGPPGFFLLDNC